jgi:glycosyltransferase involved in cell wall biosynthesis
LRILWNIHLYPPTHNCGSEYVAHLVNKFLISRGHEVRVILQQGDMHNIRTPYNFDGVEVFGPTGNLDAFRWADVIMTHLDFTQFSVLIARSIKKPLVHFVHNDHPYEAVKGAPGNNYVVYNSNWIKDKIGYRWPSMVLHPPCDVESYSVNENPEGSEYISMINLDRNKGGEILRWVAERMPDRKFLGVLGSYSSPVLTGQYKDQPPNVTVLKNTPNILSIYKQTRVLLMPSAYESWGRTATEAMCNGIPVIACPTPGLKENLGDAGIFVPARKKIEPWMEDKPENYDVTPIIKAIEKLDNKEYYKSISENCRKRAKELDPKSELNEFEEFLIKTRYGSRKMENV